MIDTCSAGFSWTSCHILSQIFYKSKKYIANHQIIQKQNRTKGQTPCAMTSHNTKENPARNIPSEAFGYTIAQGVCPRVSLIQYRDEMRVVFFIIKNVLSVYTSKHHMIDTCSAGFSWTSCHILSQIFYKSKKYIANHQIIQKQNRTKGQTPCAMTSHNTKENPARNIPSEAFCYTIAQGVCPRVS